MNRIIAGSVRAVSEAIQNAVNYAEMLGGIPSVNDL